MSLARRSLLIFSLLLHFLFSVSTSAATANRAESMRAAHVWRRPAWIDANGKFNASLDMLTGPKVSAKDRVLAQSTVSCRMTPELAVRDTNGDTPKFFAEVDGRVVKFKYRFEIGEISAEMLGTRLLWALGYGANHMFFIDHVRCSGCTADPFEDRRVDPETVEVPRVFDRLTAEHKYPGHEIKDGWSFRELLDLLPTQQRAIETAQRESLLLLAVFMRYADNKPDNQRLTCDGEVSADGGCTGDTFLLLHDLGVSFARGLIPRGPMTVVQWKEWDESPIWADPARCRASLGDNDGGAEREPVIGEAGRAHLARLLRGFAEGDAGRQRIGDLFRAAHAIERSGTIESWTNTFLRKVEEIQYPLGPNHPEFTCPTK